MNADVSHKWLEWMRWIVVALLLACFAALAIGAHRRTALPGDVRFALWLQELDWPGLDSLTRATNWAMHGTPLTVGGFLIVMAFVSLDWRLESIVLSAAIVARLANSLAKEWIGSPRPTPDLIAISTDSDGFGFPSGHAVGALLVLGATSWAIGRRVQSVRIRSIIWIIAIAIIVMTGVGRIRVGAHWPSDVLGAWLWGTAALLALAGLAVQWERRNV